MKKEKVLSRELARCSYSRDVELLVKTAEGGGGELVTRVVEGETGY